MPNAALPCTCRRVVCRSLGEGDPAAEYRVVKGRRWDCPSCGQDKRRTLADMASVAGARRLLTLTLEQPRVVVAGHPAGTVPPWLADGPLLRPAAFEHCDPATHVAWNDRHGGWRWQTVPDCSRCLDRVVRMTRLYVGRLRYHFGEVQYLRVWEEHKGGGVHVHLAVTGLPADLHSHAPSAGLARRLWADLGGGHVHLGRGAGSVAGSVGRYVGKYLAKEQHASRVPARRRRWSRSLGFAPSVRMVPVEAGAGTGGWYEPTSPLSLRGWVWTDGLERPHRQYLSGYGQPQYGPLAPPLDASTANRWDMAHRTPAAAPQDDAAACRG